MRRAYPILAAWLLTLVASAADVSADGLNRTFGLPLLGAQGDWSLASLERRMGGAGIRFQRSPGRYSAFLRGRKALGVPCEEIQVYADPKSGVVTSVDLVFANKGDTGGRYAQGIAAADRTISETLSKLCGAPKRTHVGPGAKKLRNPADLWSSPAADILLETEKREYVILHLRPPESGGEKRLTRIRDASFVANVRRNDFGDVWIDRLPMVDQGGKGYCAPATMERVLLYFGIKDAGMHKLAEAAGSSAKGGTTVPELLKAVKPLRRRTGLQYGESADLRLAWVAKYIDDGIPIFWCMYSTADYNRLRQENNLARARYSDPQEWKKQLRRQKGFRAIRHFDSAHICLIIGYNKLTDEIAVSNSWGEKENKPSWVPLKVAQRVGQGVQFVLHP